MKMQVEELASGVTVIRLDGDLDAKGIGEIEVKFAAATEITTKVVVDFQKVGFLASIGIRALLSAVKSLNRRGGKLVLLDPSDTVTQVLRTCGADGVMTLANGLDAALSALA